MFFDYDVLSSPFHVIVVVLSNYYFLFFIEVEPAGAFKQWPHTRAHLAILFVHYLNPRSFPRLSVYLLFTVQVKHFRSQANTPHSNPILISILPLFLPPHKPKKLHSFRVSSISFSIFLVPCCVFMSVCQLSVANKSCFWGLGRCLLVHSSLLLLF